MITYHKLSTLTLMITYHELCYLFEVWGGGGGYSLPKLETSLGGSNSPPKLETSLGFGFANLHPSSPTRKMKKQIFLKKQFFVKKKH